MRIVLDSSVVVGGDWNFEHNAARALLGACERGEVELYVPRVVLDEIRNAYEEREASDLKKLNGARAALRRMRGPRAGAGEFEGEVTGQPGYSAYLRGAITEAGGRILDYPDVAHPQLLERSLRRRAPFDVSGQRGYRDALIWHNVMEVAGSGKPVVFATNDGDFLAAKESDELHPHLTEELEARKVATGRVTIARSLKEVVEKVIVPAAHIRDALGRELDAKEGLRRELQEAMMHAAERGAAILDASRLEVEVGPDLEAYAGEVIEKRLARIEMPERFAIAEVVPLGDEAFGVEAWLEGPASVQLTVLVDGFSDRGPMPAGIEIASDGRNATLIGTARVRLVFEIEYDRREERLGDPGLVGVTDARPAPAGAETREATSPPGPRVGWFAVAGQNDLRTRP